MGFYARTARRVVCGASMLSMLLGGAAVAGVCASPRENAALQTRVLQSELMVAALTCGQRDKYNSFVRRFSGELTDQGSRLKSYFSRAHGGRGTSEMNSLVTNLANEASQRAMGYRGNFCGDFGVLFDSVLNVSPPQLTDFAASRPFANSHGVESCQASVVGPRPPGS